MKTSLLASIAIAASAMVGASAANASITLSFVAPGTDPYTGPTPTYDFDTVATTPAHTGGVITTGTNGLLEAQPFGSTGNYFAAGPDATSPGTVWMGALAGNIHSLSFLWGSVDQFNTLDFVDSSNNVLATFVGNDIFNPATGDRTDPNTNPVVYFTLTGSDVTNFAGLRLSSSQNAFEIDDIAVNPVPEPATWAMMLLGFGGIGLAMRRRRSDSKLAQVA